MIQPIHPNDSSKHQQDLSCLTLFLEDILAYPEETLEANVRNDIIKVINNLKFIKVNLAYLLDAVAHQHEADTYANEQDRINGVVRDFDGTSMHIKDYSDINKARTDLTDLIEQFEASISLMRDKNKLLHFAKCIEYDQNKGCIEARVIRALIFAAKFKENKILDLDTLFFECKEDYQFDKNLTLLNRQNAYFFFKPYLGLACNYQNTETIITTELIDEYLDLLGQTIEEAELERSEIEATYEDLCLNAQITLGLSQARMIQHRFQSETEANSLLNWLKQQPLLKNTGIHKASCNWDTHNLCYTVRLTKIQYELLRGMNSYEHLQQILFNKEFEAACESTEADLLKFIEEHSSDALSNALINKNKEGQTLFQKIARDQSEIAFLALISTVSTESLSLAIVTTSTDEWTGLHMAARYQPQNMLLLIDKVTTSSLNEALSKEIHGSWSAFHLAARNLPEIAFIALLNKAMPNVIEGTLTKLTDDGWNFFQLVAKYQSETALLIFMSKLTPELFEKILLIVNKDGWNLLHTIASLHTETVFLDLINNVIKSIDAAITADISGWTPVHLVARYRSETAFLTLLNLIAPTLLAKTLIEPTDGGWNLLHLVARNQSEAALLALINKATVEVLDQAIVKQVTIDLTALQIIATFQSETGFLALIDKASPKALNEALINNISALTTAAYNQSEATFSTFLSKLYDETLNTTLKSNPNLINLILHKGWQVNAKRLMHALTLDELIKTFSTLNSNSIKKLATALFLEQLIERENELVNRDDIKTVSSILLPLLPEMLDDKKLLELLYQMPTVLRKRLINMLSLQTATPPRLRLLSHLSAHSEVNQTFLQYLLLCHNTKPYKLWYICSYTEINTLEELANTSSPDWLDSVKQQVASYWQKPLAKRTSQSEHDLMLKLSAVLPEYAHRFQTLGETPLDGNAITNSLINKIKNGEVVAKVLLEDRYPEHLKALSDLQTGRIPNIRKPIPDATHKFVHLTGEIIPYTPAHLSKTTYTRTQKMSVTPLSTNCDTKLFASHHPNLESVAAVYQDDPSQDKAWFFRDHGSYHHGWHGTLDDVTIYQNFMGSINYTNHDDYKIRVNNASGMTPEKLTHLHPNRLLGVLIGKDTPKARQLAKKYAKDFQNLCKKEMPIVFYDSVAKTVRPYTQEEQDADDLSLTLNKPYNREAEQKAKASLQTIKDKILAKNDWRLHGFFAGSSYQDKRLTRTAASVLRLIDKADAAEKSHYRNDSLTWVETKAKILGLLVNGTTTKLLRDADSITFNQSLLETTFSEEERMLFVNV